MPGDGQPKTARFRRVIRCSKRRAATKSARGADVEGSDGTLILHRGPFGEGTQLTLEICRELGKPVCLVDANAMSPAMAAVTAREFIDAHDIEHLNVAGPRESRWTYAHDSAFDTVHALIVMLWYEGHGTA